jgi:archaellum biogenesis ATPase FlaH
MNDYNLDLQKLFIEFMAKDQDLFVRVNGICEPQYFDKNIRKAVSFIKEHANEYGAIPKLEQIKATTGVELDDVKEIDARHKEWFIDEFEKFCRHKALEGAILTSTDLIEKSDYGAVEKIIKDAVQIGLAKHMGTDYFANPGERIEHVRNQRGATSTGWTGIDQKLYGGFNRGELNIFAAASGGGKSLFLQNLALNWAQQGYNVIYVSLELSEELCSMRLDSMLTGYTTKDLFRNVEDVDLKIRMQGKKSGKIQIVQLPNGITVNDLNSYIKEFEVKNNMKIDGILLDYLDLMMPAQSKVSPSDLFIKDKFVSEELRNFAVEHDILFATASQLNRSAVEEIEFDHSHISGGLSKIQTADNVIGIFTSQAMRERGRYQVQFMKTRSSAGVGQKVDLAFDVSGLRITDLEDDDQPTPQSETNALYDRIKRKTMSDTDTNPNVPAVENIGSDRLKSILKKQD